MQDFRKDPIYNDVLISASIFWCGILDIARFSTPRVGEQATRIVQKRCFNGLPQIVQEMTNGDWRWNRCRWREIRMKDWFKPKMSPGKTAHVEHPWPKHRTEEYIEKSVIGALERGVSARNDVLVECVSSILDARCDTILLPDGRLSQYGIISDKKGDGFRERYLSAVQMGTIRIWDPLESREVSVEEMLTIDDEKMKQVEDAINRIRSIS